MKAFCGPHLGGDEFENWVFTSFVDEEGCGHQAAAITVLNDGEGEPLVYEWKFFP